MTATQCASTPDGRLAQLHGYALGGVIGFAYGSHIAKKKAQYKSTEDWLDACIAQADSTRRQAVAYNQQTDHKIASLQNQVKMARVAGDKAQLAALKSKIGSEKAAAQKQAVVLSKEADIQNSNIKEAGTAGGSRLSSLRASTSGIETQISVMNKNVERYAVLESQTDV